MSDPLTIIGELQDLTGRLDKASRELYGLQEEFDRTAEQYSDAVNDLKVALLDRYEEEGKRLPGEDVRDAIIAKQLREEEPILFGSYRRLKSELARGHDRARLIERQISSYQSVLSYLRTEVQAAG